MKRLIFVLLALVSFAIAGDAQGMWIKSQTQGDKVEQCNGSDVFYIILFSLMALVGRSMIRFTIAEYKELKHGNNK